jgi:hypothetical protein
VPKRLGKLSAVGARIVAMLKSFLVITVAALVGNMVAEKFVLKAPGSDSGFVEVKDGIGMDDFARAATIGAAVLVAKKFVG